MDFTFNTENNVLKVKVETPRLDGASSYILESETRPRLGNVSRIDIDCTSVRMIDSSGLVGLVTLAKLMALQSHEKVRLLELHPSVEKLMRLSHLDQVFDIELAENA